MYSAVCLELPSCPEPAAPFLCGDRPHLSCTSQKHHLQILTPGDWWKSPLHPFTTETEDWSGSHYFLLLLLMLFIIIMIIIMFFKSRWLPHLTLA